MLCCFSFTSRFVFVDLFPPKQNRISSVPIDHHPFLRTCVYLCLLLLCLLLTHRIWSVYVFDVSFSLSCLSFPWIMFLSKFFIVNWRPFWFLFLFFKVMEAHCNLEVDVNGEETFMVDKVKKIKKNSPFSSLISKLFF